MLQHTSPAYILASNTKFKYLTNRAFSCSERICVWVEIGVDGEALERNSIARHA